MHSFQNELLQDQKNKISPEYNESLFNEFILLKKPVTVKKAQSSSIKYLNYAAISLYTIVLGYLALQLLFM